jgi:hypothetical protein
LLAELHAQQPKKPRHEAGGDAHGDARSIAGRDATTVARIMDAQAGPEALNCEAHVVVISNDAMDAILATGDKEACMAATLVPGTYWLVHPDINGFPCWKQQAPNEPGDMPLIMVYMDVPAGNEPSGWCIIDKLVTSAKDYLKHTYIWMVSFLDTSHVGLTWGRTHAIVA